MKSTIVADSAIFSFVDTRRKKRNRKHSDGIANHKHEILIKRLLRRNINCLSSPLSTFANDSNDEQKHSFISDQQALYLIGTKTGANHMKKHKRQRKLVLLFQLLCTHMDRSLPFLDSYSWCIVFFNLLTHKLSIC